MDPLTAFANMTTAICQMITAIANGQSPEQRKIMWDWYIADVARLRKFFNVPDAPPPG